MPGISFGGNTTNAFDISFQIVLAYASNECTRPVFALALAPLTMPPKGHTNRASCDATAAAREEAREEATRLGTCSFAQKNVATFTLCPNLVASGSTRCEHHQAQASKHHKTRLANRKKKLTTVDETTKKLILFRCVHIYCSHTIQGLFNV